MTKLTKEYTSKDIRKIETIGENIVFTFKDGVVAEYPLKEFLAIDTLIKFKSDKVN